VNEIHRPVTSAIIIAAAIFAARDLAAHKDPRDPRAVRAIEEAISKARYIVEIITRKLKSRPRIRTDANSRMASRRSHRSHPGLPPRDCVCYAPAQRKAASPRCDCSMNVREFPVHGCGWFGPNLFLDHVSSHASPRPLRATTTQLECGHRAKSFDPESLGIVLCTACAGCLGFPSPQPEDSDEQRAPKFP
jgi:hypothetical protein